MTMTEENETPEQAAVDDLVEAGLLDELMARVDAGEVQLTGEGGFLPAMIKAVLERGLAAELTDHLGYDKGDPAGRGSPNSRNGSTPKTVATEVGDVPLVADMSSDILSRPVDVAKYGLIYAGAQKNIGPAGLTIVIVREDLIGQSLPVTPSAFDYKTVADNDSMYNTPPTYAIYIAGLVFEWIVARGGLAAMEAHNRAKAAVLYDYLDSQDFYRSPVARDCRSLMNVPFKLADEALDAAFLKGADARGLVQLKGHRSVGGMRASIYNAMPVEGVQALVAYMRDFVRERG